MISYLDEYAERLTSFAMEFVLRLKPHLPLLDRHEISDDEAFICWAYYLSYLGVEAQWAVLHLIRQNAVRIGYGVTRSLFEYLTKLEYYAEHRDDARIAYASIAERILFHGNNYGNLAPELIEEARRHQQRWKANEPASSFKALLNFSSALSTVAPEHAKRLMTEFYESPSGFVHGAGHSMPDVLQARFLADTTYDINKSVSDACLHLLCMLDRLRRAFPKVYADDMDFDACFAEYAALVGDHMLWKDELEGSDAFKA